MRAFFLTKFKFPFNDASSLRYSFLSVLFSNLGYNCFFVGSGFSEYKKWIDYKYGKYISLRQRTGFSNITSSLFFEKRVFKTLKEMDVKKDDVVIIAHFFANTTIKRIKNYCINRGALLLFSVQEKYAKPSKKLGTKDFFLTRAEYNKSNSFYRRIKEYGCPIISISSYLNSVATKNNLPSICIPFVYDRSFFEMPILKHSGDKIKLVYAGFPGGKDMLYEMMKAISLVNDLTNDAFQLSVYGPDDSWARKKLNEKDYECFKRFTLFNGFIEKQDLLKEFAAYDFSILLRPNKAEYAAAGFPTKVTESLFCGVPVISNYTSDLEDYLENMVNSIKVEDDTINGFLNALLVASSLSGSQISKMKSDARESFLKKLDVNLFQKTFNSFMKKLIN